MGKKEKDESKFGTNTYEEEEEDTNRYRCTVENRRTISSIPTIRDRYTVDDTDETGDDYAIALACAEDYIVEDEWTTDSEADD